MADTYVLRFNDASSTHDLVGGKGANLAALVQAGFLVPPGFTVTTAGYAEFLRAAGLGSRIDELVATLDYADAPALERTTAQIRELITGAGFPPSMIDGITSAYGELGDAPDVAVRSSGTAEDLAEASFAGMHDTYLDIAGRDQVLDAIKRCWASLWTARATSYRHTLGFDHSNGIAVVVQKMVPSEVSGVMFTANPLTAATNEIVINASWGLGEAIVSGIATPDEFVVASSQLRVIERKLGGKEKRVVRDPETGVGTVAEDNPPDNRERFCLDDVQVRELAGLGQRVQAHYGGFPQDTEWGYADGQFFLLQSRPVTGVHLSWDADCDDWQWMAETPDDQVYTRAWADEVWTGAVTPLFYSIRGYLFTWAHEAYQQIWGFPETAKMRLFTYHKGGAYYNCNIDRANITNTSFQAVRPGMLANVPPAWHQEILEQPFSLVQYAKLQLRLNTIDKHGRTFGWIEANNQTYVHGSIESANSVPPEELRSWSDAQVKAELNRLSQIENEYGRDVLHGFWIHARDSFAAVATMFAKWYDGGEVKQFTELITGTPRKTATMVENAELWALSEEIRHSELLGELFEAHQDGAFFEACGDSEEGRAWLKRYEQFLVDHGHRGHADRDFWFIRRAEDPAVDYRSLKSFLSIADTRDPEVKEKEVEAERVRIVEHVAENMRRKSFGTLRAELFKGTMDYLMRFLMFRDDERHWVDRSTFSMKRCCKEIGRRLQERGLLEGDTDFYFLTRHELFRLLDGDPSQLPLMKAKIAARRKNFEAVLNREASLPLYLQRGRNADAEFDRAAGVELPEGIHQGMGTSGGLVEGIARVVPTLQEIGRVQDGEILITNSTDPGWTPVFLLLTGIILETGGLLAHGSCLAREYGMPAVQLSRAMSIIPDGARIRMNGDTGQVEILDAEEGAAVSGEVPATA
ncbi:MAG TPA: PEP/pyruvate-binding domain-containing protein [Solirubrobacteraceae bacterium]|jgi:pyruvate,water dikinase|nr:PEP/pyruvate-binding domain-containing protein [Solirubrobacteraceae bacterium]